MSRISDIMLERRCSYTEAKRVAEQEAKGSFSAPALLACPFCGTKPTVSKGKKRTKDTTWAKAGEWMWMPEIKCKRCKLGKHGNSLVELTEWWNKRRTQWQANDAAQRQRPEHPKP